jgi:hypothetical protein
VSQGKIGFAWTASQGQVTGGFGNFPSPYVHVVRINESTHALIDEPYFSNQSYAFAFPSIAPNGRGDVGGTFMWGGGTQYENCGGLVWDAYSNNTWQFFAATASNADPTDPKGGDFLSTRKNGGNANTWSAPCYALVNGGSQSNVHTYYFSFGRAQDSPFPGAPTNVTAAAGNASANVSWTPASDGGNPITNYIVTPYIGTIAQTATRVGNITSTIIGSLTNGTTYTFKVAAVNAFGTGPQSAVSNAVTPSGATTTTRPPTTTSSTSTSTTSSTRASTTTTNTTSTTSTTSPGQCAVPSLGCPQAVAPNGTFVADVMVNVGSTPLGAHSFTLTWDRTLVSVTSVVGGSTSEFSSNPTCNVNNTTGTASCTAFQTASLTGPTGILDIAHVNLTAVGSAGSRPMLTLTINSLFDTQDRSICVQPPTNSCSVNIDLCGDVNGDRVVNIGDALVVAQYTVGLRQCGVAPLSNPLVCDVNLDGACNIGDALRMAQCDVGLISCGFTCRPFTCP